MQFTVRWVLALIAYLAIVFASVAYASTPWIDALAVAAFLATAIAATAVLVLAGNVRAFAAGFTVFSVLTWFALFSSASTTELVRAAARRWSDAATQFVPNRQAVVRRYLAANSQPSTGIGEIWIHRRDASGDWEVSVEYLNPRNVKTMVIPSAKFGGAPSDHHVRAALQIHAWLLASLLGGRLALLMHRWQEPDGAKTN